MGQYDTLQTQIRAARVAFAYDLVRSILQMAADDLGMDIQIGHDNVDTRPGSASTSGYLNCPDLTFVVDVAIGFLDQPYPVTVSVQLYDADLVQLQPQSKSLPPLGHAACVVQMPFNEHVAEGVAQRAPCVAQQVREQRVRRGADANPQHPERLPPIALTPHDCVAQVAR